MFLGVRRRSHGTVRNSRDSLFIHLLTLLLASITATPYFLSRLNGSQYQSTFPSYLSSSYNAASFLSLIYSTVTSTRVRQSISCTPLAGVDQSAAGFSCSKNICIYYCIGILGPSIDTHHFRSRTSPFLLLVHTVELHPPGMRILVPTAFCPCAFIAFWSQSHPGSHIRTRSYSCGCQWRTDAERYCFCLEYKPKNNCR